jgi:phospholipase C
MHPRVRAARNSNRGEMMSRKRMAAAISVIAAAAIAGATMIAAGTASAGEGESPIRDQTATPIKHLVVIFQENVSFDHYFGTYPNAADSDGQPFQRRPALRR